MADVLEQKHGPGQLDGRHHITKEAGKLNTPGSVISHKKNFLFGFIQMTRLHTGMQAVAFLLLSKYLTDHQTRFLEPHIIMGGVVVISTVAFGFVIDEIRDAATDKIVKPNNAIPSGRVSHGSAVVLAVLFAVCSSLIASSLGKLPFAITTVNLLLCFSYAYFFRNSPILSIFIIAYLNGSIAIFGSALAGKITILTGFVFSLIFLFTCAQEILYSVIDHDADKTYSVHTAATVLGINNSLRLFNFFLLLTILVTVYLGKIFQASSHFEILMIPCTIVPLALAISIIITSSSSNRVTTVSKILYITRILSFIALWTL